MLGTVVFEVLPPLGFWTVLVVRLIPRKTPSGNATAGSNLDGGDGLKLTSRVVCKTNVMRKPVVT